MDPKIEIKQEDPLSDDIGSQNETEFFHKVVTMKRNSDVLLDNDSVMATKTEIKSETPPKYFVKRIKCETGSSGNWEIDRKTENEEQTLFSDFGSPNEEEFLPDDLVMKDEKYDTEHGMDNKIEIKVEPWWIETETSSVCDDIKDGGFSPVTSSRLCMETVSGAGSGKSPLLPAEVSGRDRSFLSGTDHHECKLQKSDVSEMPTTEGVFSEQSGKCDVEEMCASPLYFNRKSSIHKGQNSQNCDTCTKGFSCPSHLKTINLIHKVKKPHQCKICDKSFTRISHLKIHNLIHEGKKPHQCKICDKCFTRESHLKTHHLIHEGKKPHQCKTCGNSFTHLSTLKRHYLVHEGKKPHQCTICDKTFTLLSNLKAHNVIHEGKKPHQCKTCDKSFARLADMRQHELIHEGKKPHQCKACDKCFTHLSQLKRHTLIHEGKKPHHCKVCEKSFSELSNLRKHNLIHEGKKPHHCKTCDKSFTQLSTLKRHSLTHEGKK